MHQYSTVVFVLTAIASVVVLRGVAAGLALWRRRRSRSAAVPDRHSV